MEHPKIASLLDETRESAHHSTADASPAQFGICDQALNADNGQGLPLDSDFAPKEFTGCYYFFPLSPETKPIRAGVLKRVAAKFLAESFLDDANLLGT